MTRASFEVNHLQDLDVVSAFLLQWKEKYKVMAFYGPMGAGKTTLIKNLCRRMGVTDEVNSPTFSIVNEYLTRDEESVFHFDFYRINKLEEAYDIGYENYFYGGSCCLIEWPEKISQLLPDLHVKVEITPSPSSEQRIVVCSLVDLANS